MASRPPRCMARLMLTQPSLPKSGEEPQGTAGCRGAGGTGRAPGLSPTEVTPCQQQSAKHVPPPEPVAPRGEERQKGITEAGDLHRPRRFEITIIWPRGLFWRGSGCPAPSRAMPS